MNYLSLTTSQSVRIIFYNFLYYRKIYGTQHLFIRLLGEYRKKLDQNKIVGTVFLDLPKTFSYIIRDLVVAKLNGYSYFWLIFSCLSNRFHFTLGWTTFRASATNIDERNSKNDWLKLNPTIVNPKKFQFRFISEKRNALPGR